MNNKKYENQIKDLLKNDYLGKLFGENEIPPILALITSTLKIDNDIELNEISSTAIQFLYYSSKEDKYHFNIKRKQPKKRIYHNRILSSIKDNIPQSNIKNNNSISSKIGSNLVLSSIDNEIDPSSEDLEKIENQIFKKIENIDQNNDQLVEFSEYIYPVNFSYKPIKKFGEIYGPFGTQWFHDIQFDDVWEEVQFKFAKQFDILRAIKLPPQGTDEWFKMRDGKITASDGGTVLDRNSHEPQYKFILKKTTDMPFLCNEFVHHGKKYEDVATIIYEYRMNVSTSEFGLIAHPKYDFLGASPDRICNKYKLDGKHISKYIGRMLEIKCPLVRKILMDGKIIDGICPIYYWIQVQLQLECCDLEECDFWQCEIKEYSDRDEFICDTDPNEPFRSKTTKFEKGCIIQLLPKDKMNDIINGKYKEVVESKSIFIYAPKIEMTPYDCDIWINEMLTEIKFNPTYKDYFFDKVIYWKLVRCKNVTINRDRKWFADNLPKLREMWEYVLFFRKNKHKLKILTDYIESRKIKKNKDIMNIISQIYQTDDPNYDKIIQNILDDIENSKIKKEMKMKQTYDYYDYMFVDPPPKNNSKNNDYSYMFIDDK